MGFESVSPRGDYRGDVQDTRLREGLIQVITEHLWFSVKYLSLLGLLGSLSS